MNRCNKCKKLFEDRFMIRTKHFIKGKTVCSECYEDVKLGSMDSFKCLVATIGEYRQRYK